MYLLLVASMAGFIIYLNYFRSQGIENIVSLPATWGGGFTRSYLTYFIPFAIAYLLQLFFYRDNLFYRNKWFLLILTLAPGIFALRTNFDFHHSLIGKLGNEDVQLFWIHCSKWIVGLFVTLIPVYFIWKLKDSSTEPFYGTRRLRDTKPYLLLIACMIPLIALAATQPDFLKMYPRANFVTPLDLHPKSIYYMLHEIFYSLDFITIEIFFRGFLVIALLKICGPRCIIPAACFYCCIHLGKPMGEAISSFAGGLLLGIVSYNTRSIRGGLTVHLGIAWLMEIAGFIAHQL